MADGRGSGTVPSNSRSTTARAAIDAHRARLPRVVEVVKAIAIAELEARGGYDEADHGPFFERTTTRTR